MPTEKVNEATRREWRELGFFYERNDVTKEWLIRGSRAGLFRLAQALLEYSKNPRRQPISEHDHLGPYMYLKIGTWSARVIDNHWNAGTLEDLSTLSALIAERISKAAEGDALLLRAAYAPASPYELRLDVSGDGFDPATADKACW